MARQATLSTAIEPGIKKAVSLYCRRHGFRLRHVVEEALLDRLEDELDLEAYRRRRNEETIPLERVVKEIRRRAKNSGS